MILKLSRLSIPRIAAQQAAAGMVIKLPGVVDVFLQRLQRPMAGDGGELEHTNTLARFRAALISQPRRKLLPAISG